MSRGAGWNQFSASAAENYERFLVPAQFGPWAEVLVDRTGVSVGQRVLDVACGTGVVARAAAGLVGLSGSVVGSDLNEGMLAEAARHVGDGVNVEWRHADAERLPFDDETFNVVLCQQGLQFIPDRAAAVAEMRRVLGDGGRAVVAVWKSLDHNPVARARREALARYLSADVVAPIGEPFGFDDPDGLAELFSAAGFGDLSVEPVELVIPSDDPRASMEGILGAMRIAEAIAAIDGDPYEAMVDDMVAAVEPWIIDGTLRAPSTTNLVIARR